MTADANVTAAERGPLRYEPNRTLGRSGYVDTPRDRLHDTLRHLDALLSLISSHQEFPQDGNEFMSMNSSVQFAILELASDLATEAHEISERLLHDDELLQ